MNAAATPEAVAPLRSSYMGGGDIASVLGISPFSTPVQTWLAKRGELTREDDPILRRGRRLEPYVRDTYAEETGRIVSPGAFIQGPEPWIGGNIDGATNDFRLFEAKTAHPRTRKDWGDEGTDSIPVYYTAQVQWYLMLTRLDYADLAAFMGIDDFRIFTIEADVALQASLLAKAREFWRLVQIGVPPEVQEADDVKLLYPQHFDGATVEATGDDFDALNELKTLREDRKASEKREEELALTLYQRMGSAEALTFEGRTLATWKTQSATRIDVKALRIAHPEIAEQFERVGTSRVFRIK